MDAEYATKKEEVRKQTEAQHTFILSSAKTDAAAVSQRETSRIRGAAKLQAKKNHFDATEKMLETNVDALRQSLADLAASKEYPELLTRMAKYASKRLGGDIRVACRPSDADLLKKAGAKVLSADLNAIGGFKANSKDGSLELDFTFEELLRSHQEDARALMLEKA